MHGFGKFTFADGKTYEGQYFNDKKHGYGIFSWLNSKRYEGWWTDGKQDGYGILYDGTTKKLFGQWKDGQKVKTLPHEEAKQVLKDYDGLQDQGEVVQRLTFYSPKGFTEKREDIQI